MSLGITGIRQLLPLSLPAQTTIAVMNAAGAMIGQIDMRRNKAWFDFLSGLFGLGQQIFVTGTLSFGLVAAQTSADLTIPFTIAGAFVKRASFVQIHSEPLAPANTELTADMSADNVLTVRFNNYSAAGVTPAALTIDALITLPGKN